ncbi:MAG: hypothetical protein KDB57_03465 [Solirubrobacterales bacterium]|jgi:hypothetical protein|nr:hypothetical protein [Solirubrobacterales bacterium]
MAEKPAKRNRDGSRIGSSEYVTLALCLIVPLIGLIFAFYYRQEGESWADRAIIVGFVALFVWAALVLFL